VGLFRPVMGQLYIFKTDRHKQRDRKKIRKGRTNLIKKNIR
jgi:hypothetical protein